LSLWISINTHEWRHICERIKIDNLILRLLDMEI
jgi:hypothetical protein